MDDFLDDDLFVPDNWLEQSRKRESGHVAEGTNPGTPPKKRKLSSDEDKSDCKDSVKHLKVGQCLQNGEKNNNHQTDNHFGRHDTENESRIGSHVASGSKDFEGFNDIDRTLETIESNENQEAMSPHGSKDLKKLNGIDHRHEQIENHKHSQFEANESHQAESNSGEGSDIGSEANSDVYENNIQANHSGNPLTNQTGPNEKDSEHSVINVSSASDISLKTEEDNSLNEPEFIEKIPSPPTPLLPDIGSENGANQGSTADQKDLGIVDLTQEGVPPAESEAGGSEHSKPYIKKIVSVMRDAKIISGIVSNKNVNDIYDLLLDNRDKPDRLDLVTSVLLDGSGDGGVSGVQNNPEGSLDIFGEVELVLKSVPKADANEVYTLLESMPPHPNRVKSVVKKLGGKLEVINEIKTEAAAVPLRASDSSGSVEDDPLLKNDPLFRDMRTIAKIFPDKDRNEIYALLEANFDKKDRLQTVLNEMMLGLGNQHDQSGSSHAAEIERENLFSEENSIEREVEKMKMLFPDCDPNYLFERLEQMGATQNRTDVLAAELFDKKNYPTLKEVEEKAEQKTRLQRLQNLQVTVEEFLQKFPEPETTFGDETKDITPLYRQHAELLLKNEFRVLQAGYLKHVLNNHRGHLLPAYREVSAAMISVPIAERRQHKKFLKSGPRAKVPMPATFDEYFYHELWFVYNEQKLADDKKEKEQERQRKLDEAKAKGELYECCCCFDDECLFEDLASCPEGHLFCKLCVLRSTEAAFGEMKTTFPCLTGDCDQNITLSTIQSIVPSNLFSKIIRRMQEEEVQQANIPDLITCPFCPFATIMSNPDDKVLKCLNPDCLKESCRLCQEPNHIPLRCNEVEKKAATDMRTYIENYISEAVMRKCHKCKKNFVKESGCNKMTCICGATSCYACKKEGIDYDHFNHNKECGQTDPKMIHQRDMERAAVEAKNQYLLDHPEATEVELKSDVVDLIKDFQKPADRGRKRPKPGRRRR